MLFFCRSGICVGSSAGGRGGGREVERGGERMLVEAREEGGRWDPAAAVPRGWWVAGPPLQWPVQKRASPSRPNPTCPSVLDISSDLRAVQALKSTGYVQGSGGHPQARSSHCLPPGAFSWPRGGQCASSESITLGSAERTPELS